MAKVTYDKESNIMSIRLKNAKSVDSDVKGNCVLDYDAKGKVVNIEILDFNLEEAITKKKK